MVKIHETTCRRPVIKTGILFFHDGLNSVSDFLDFSEADIQGFGTPLEILNNRFSKISQIDKRILAHPENIGAKLADKARSTGLDLFPYSLAEVIEKPKSFTQRRWGLDSDSGSETWVGTVFFCCS